MAAPAYPFEPVTLRKGDIVAVDTVSSPPTVSITLSGDTQEIPGIRFADHYSPVVGDVVEVFKQGSAHVVWGQLMVGTGSPEEPGAPGGWLQPTMSAGYTNVAAGRGFVRFRRIIDNGAPKIQWSGAVVRATGTTTQILSGLPEDCRPPETRSFIAARSAAGGSNSVVLEFQPAGTVNIAGDTTSTDAVVAVNQSTTADNNDTTVTINSTTASSGDATVTINSTTADNNNSTITIHNTTADNNSSASGLSQLNDRALPSNAPDANFDHKHDIAVTHDHFQNPHSHGNDSHDHSQNPHNHTSPAHSHAGTAHSHTSPAHDHSQNAHTHVQNAHAHTVSMPASSTMWISLDGIEYFV